MCNALLSHPRASVNAAVGGPAAWSHHCPLHLLFWLAQLKSFLLNEVRVVYGMPVITAAQGESGLLTLRAADDHIALFCAASERSIMSAASAVRQRGEPTAKAELSAAVLRGKARRRRASITAPHLMTVTPPCRLFGGYCRWKIKTG